MFKLVVILASLLSAAAFAPARFTARSSSLKMNYENEVGVLPPTGFWDPFGLTKNIDDATFDKYRTAELKHGRVCMLAVVGYIVQESLRLPGSLNGTPFSEIPNGVDALSAINPFGWFQIGASIGYWEIFGWKQVEGSWSGNFGFLNKSVKEAELPTLRVKELQNGRLAMLAAAELLTHDIATNGESLFTIHHF